MIEIKTSDEFTNILKNKNAVLAYFSNKKCSVCLSLKPKLNEVLTKKFPLLEKVYIDIEQLPIISADYQVFTVPVVLIFFEGKESVRKIRAFGIEEITSCIERPYKLLFD